MQSNLSFTPRYHELAAGEGSTTWVPMYNPARECVEAECRQIKEEGGRVNSRAWKMPPEVRRQSWLHTLQCIDALLIWLLIAFFMGEVLTTKMFPCPWVMQLSWPAQVAVTTGVGMALLMCLWRVIRACAERKKAKR